MERSEKFPPNCPPRKAKKASGEVYRLVGSNPPAAKDFRSWYELYKDKTYNDEATKCQACGLSVYTQKSDVSSLINRIPGLRKKKIALGKLTPDLGVMLNTPSFENEQSHHTWWFPVGKEPWTVFQVVDISK
jgi:hypothetical protein